MEKQIFKLRNKEKQRLGIKLSRNEKRQAERELKHFHEQVEPFMVEFESQLFDDSIKRSYNDIYSSFLETIILTCEQLNRFEFKIIEVDPYFFHNEYKPLELN